MQFIFHFARVVLFKNVPSADDSDSKDSDSEDSDSEDSDSEDSDSEKNHGVAKRRVYRSILLLTSCA